MNEYRYGAPEGEKPLENLVADGGYTSIFRTVACIGDSLSSGEFEVHYEEGKRGYYDMFEYSWGQFIARMAGCTVYNFSRGGMRASEYCESYAALRGWWDPDKKAQAYIIALGVNDLFNSKEIPGQMSDIDPDDPEKNAKTFTGYYARIIQQYKKIAPDAKFFLVSTPDEKARSSEESIALMKWLSDRLHELADYFDNTYVIDLYHHAPAHDAIFRDRFYLNGHMNVMGYRLTAEQICSYIDYIIRHNYKDFINVPFINTDIPFC